MMLLFCSCEVVGVLIFIVNICCVTPLTVVLFCLPQDVLEFVDAGCNGFLSNMCLVIASYNDMFLSRAQTE